MSSSHPSPLFRLDKHHTVTCRRVWLWGNGCHEPFAKFNENTIPTGSLSVARETQKPLKRPPSTMQGNNDDAMADTPGEATMLVSEFPPPPDYYEFMNNPQDLTPPPIPEEALQRGTRRAAAAAAKARAESEQLRLGLDSTDTILGGVAQDEEEQGDVLAVFGEIVEDPLTVKPIDTCDDPRIVRDKVKELNQHVLEKFVKLLQDLVHRPGDNKQTRDDLTHHIFLMLQECNKFREHQARETLIELLEQQLAERKKLVHELLELTDKANELLQKRGR